jgi:hypothetical protein
MGRTNPTFRDELEQLRREWRPYRRALRRENQAAFDALLEHAQAHADAASYANPTDPVVLALLSMLLAQEKERRRLEREIAEFMA